MTALFIYNQRNQPDADALELCGECAVASALNWVGVPTNPGIIANALREQFGGHQATINGTDQDELGWYCAQRGVDWTWSNSTGIQGVQAGLASGHPVLIGIHDNNNADPDPAGRFRHWILAYRDNKNGTIQCGNSWAATPGAPTGRDLAYPIAALKAAYFESMEIHRSPALNPSPIGDDMTWDMNMKRAFIFGIRLDIAGDWPESVGSVDSYASQIHDNGDNIEEIFTNIKTDFANGGEGLLGDRVKALEAAAHTGGVTLDQVRAEIAKAFTAGAQNA